MSPKAVLAFTPVAPLNVLATAPVVVPVKVCAAPVPAVSAMAWLASALSCDVASLRVVELITITRYFVALTSPPTLAPPPLP